MWLSLMPPLTVRKPHRPKLEQAAGESIVDKCCSVEFGRNIERRVLARQGVIYCFIRQQEINRKRDCVSGCCCLVEAAFVRARKVVGRTGCLVPSDKGFTLCARNPSLLLQMKCQLLSHPSNLLPLQLSSAISKQSCAKVFEAIERMTTPIHEPPVPKDCTPVLDNPRSQTSSVSEATSVLLEKPGGQCGPIPTESNGNLSLQLASLAQAEGRLTTSFRTSMGHADPTAQGSRSISLLPHLREHTYQQGRQMMKVQMRGTPAAKEEGVQTAKASFLRRPIWPITCIGINSSCQKKDLNVTQTFTNSYGPNYRNSSKIIWPIRD